VLVGGFGWSPNPPGIRSASVVGARHGEVSSSRGLSCRSVRWTLSNLLLNGAAGTLLVALTLVQQEAGLSSLQSGPMTVGYLVAILSTIRVGEKLLQRWGPRDPMLLGCGTTGLGIILTTFTFLLARQYIAVAFVGFMLFGVGLGFYATPSTDAALSNVPQDKAGSASGVYKMASSLGAAFGVALSGALFTGLAHQQDPGWESVTRRDCARSLRGGGHMAKYKLGYLIDSLAKASINR
jgi:MFS family permease